MQRKSRKNNNNNNNSKKYSTAFADSEYESDSILDSVNGRGGDVVDENAIGDDYSDNKYSILVNGIVKTDDEEATSALEDEKKRVMQEVKSVRNHLLYTSMTD